MFQLMPPYLRPLARLEPGRTRPAELFMDADAGYYVSNNASISQTVLRDWNWQNQTGQSTCMDASAGYYESQQRLTRRFVGTYQPTTGQTSCFDADLELCVCCSCYLSDPRPPGYYVNLQQQLTRWLAQLVPTSRRLGSLTATIQIRVTLV